jgi:transcriptional regulator with XRE-family HTH domain
LRDLICDMIERDTRSLGEIANKARMSRRQLGRILAGEKPLRLVDLRHLSEVLQIDRARAVVAIEVLGDWRSYDDPVLCIMMRLIRPVVEKVNASTDFPIEALTGPAKIQLSEWLAKTIITNEEQIRHRRNEFVKLPNL